MCVRHLGFVFLVWFPGTLQAQSAALPCRAPRLKGGYLVPQHEEYFHGAELSYACDEGLKPAVEGWWARSTCSNGTWSHEPQCIDEMACFPPDIPNAKYTETQSGWYRGGQTIRITCDKGYENKAWHATAQCINGTWSSVPVCEKSVDACGEPPYIPHAIIIHQGYQEIFAADSKLLYECEDGYTVDEGTEKLIICIAGTWTEAPVCNRGTKPGAGQGGSTVGGTGGGDTTLTGSGTQPAGGGSSTTGSNKGDGTPQITEVEHCGTSPIIPNGDIVEQGPMFLKYQCNGFYTTIGSDTVTCLNNGRWSQLPICKATFCTLTPAQHGHVIKLSGVQYVKEGETKFPCIWSLYNVFVKCINGILSYTRCCHEYDHQRGLCEFLQG